MVKGFSVRTAILGLATHQCTFQCSRVSVAHAACTRYRNTALDLGILFHVYDDTVSFTQSTSPTTVISEHKTACKLQQHGNSTIQQPPYLYLYCTVASTSTADRSTCTMHSHAATTLYIIYWQLQACQYFTHLIQMASPYRRPSDR